MPIIRKTKIPDESYITQYLTNGPCLKIGSEIWFIEGKKLSVGEVQKIDEKGVYIRTATGIVFKTTAETILMAETDPMMKKFLATQATIKKKTDKK
jgi:hypothetical protein